MLQNFRKKINSVIQNIELPDNLRNNSSHSHPTSIFGVPVTRPSSFLYQKEDAYSSSNIRHHSSSLPSSPTRAPKSINLSAGFRQLDKNQDQWQSIRSMNEKNGNMAAELDERITSARNISEQRLTSIKDLNMTLSVLPSIVDQLKTAREMIEEINSTAVEVEEKMMQLQDLVEVLDLQEKQLDMRFELAMFKEKKMAELEVVRERLSKEHVENVVRYEKGLRKVQQERQLVFQDAFQDDLKYYKETGSVPSERSVVYSSFLILIPFSLCFRTYHEKSPK